MGLRILAAAVYAVGYAVVLGHNLAQNFPLCHGYSIIFLGAMFHFGLEVVETAKRRHGEAQPPHFGV